MKPFKQFYLESAPKEGDTQEFKDREGNKFYQKYLNGCWAMHREDGPAREGVDGRKSWFIDGVRHRIDGPAIIDANGTKMWFVNGVHHRDNGPAVEYADGGTAWYRMGLLHREDGPAYEDADGRKEWYINGVNVPEAEFYRQLVKLGKLEPTGSDWGRML